MKIFVLLFQLSLHSGIVGSMKPILGWMHVIVNELARLDVVGNIVSLLEASNHRHLWRRSVPEPSRELAPDVLESQLKGKTLIVYWYLIQQPSHSVGVREVQRALGFSSPSIAAHHLDKLLDLGLAEKKGTGEYVLQEEVKVGILKFFMHMGRFVVPRYLFYSVLFTTMFAVYLIMCLYGQVVPSFYAVVFATLALLFFWFETIRLWRAKPF